MQVSYFYDTTFPSQAAAAIQIFNTCRALCEYGVAVTVHTGPMISSTVEEGLDFYGLSPHKNLGIMPFFDSSKESLTLQGELRVRLRDIPLTDRHFIVSRGEPGLALFRGLRDIGRGPQERYIFEAHRLCYTEAAGFVQPHFGLWGRYRIARHVARIRGLEKATVEGADGLICVTPGVLSMLRQVARVGCPTLILPSGTVVSPEEPPRDADRDIDILYAGKLEYRKGVDHLVEAMRLLPEYRLWIAGGTPQEVEKLARLAKACGVLERITLTGWIKPLDARALFQRTRVGVCPLPSGVSLISDLFTCPLKILDMMACGTPIVATDLSTVRALVEHNRTALLVEANDPQALAGAVRTLLVDRALASRLSTEARIEVSHYSWATRARRMLSFLESLR
jgi:glycosyltransferase involved in cell wall biosynthesis